MEVQFIAPQCGTKRLPVRISSIKKRQHPKICVRNGEINLIELELPRGPLDCCSSIVTPEDVSAAALSLLTKHFARTVDLTDTPVDYTASRNEICKLQSTD